MLAYSVVISNLYTCSSIRASKMPKEDYWMAVVAEVLKEEPTQALSKHKAYFHSHIVHHHLH